MQVAFNVASSTLSAAVAALIYSYARGVMPEPLALGMLAAAYHFANTFPVAGIIALTESLSPWTIFTRKDPRLLAYYAGGASLAWMIGTMPHAIQWEVPIICLPVVYLVHRSYSTYMVQMEQEKKHVEALNALHMRTIEALALAIEAKDPHHPQSPRRVQLYALEIGKGTRPGAGRKSHALHAAAFFTTSGSSPSPSTSFPSPENLPRTSSRR